MTDHHQPRSTAWLGAGAALAVLSIAGPASAHGISGQAGLAGGALHPLLGADHLLLLLAVGAAASAITPQLLTWALAGGLIGAVVGVSGAPLPALEVLAALAISVVALLALGGRQRWRVTLPAAGSLVAMAVALHAMLHGQEAPADGSALLWWLGALLTSTLVSGGTYAVLRRLPLAWTSRLALLLGVLGAGAALSL